MTMIWQRRSLAKETRKGSAKPRVGSKRLSVKSSRFRWKKLFVMARFFANSSTNWLPAPSLRSTPPEPNSKWWKTFKSKKFAIHCNAIYDHWWTWFLDHYHIRFQKACMAYGVNEIDVFQTVDLWERKDFSQVTTTIFALARAVSSNLQISQLFFKSANFSNQPIEMLTWILFEIWFNFVCFSIHFV